MDKKYLKEVNEMMAFAEFDSLKESEVIHVKCQDLYIIAEQFLGDDHVNFIADHSSGEAQDNLRKLEFANELCMYDGESSMAIKQRILQVNALRKRHMEIEEEEDKIEAYLDDLDKEEDGIKEALKSMGLVAEEEDREEPEVYGGEDEEELD